LRLDVLYSTSARTNEYERKYRACVPPQRRNVSTGCPPIMPLRAYEFVGSLWTSKRYIPIPSLRMVDLMLAIESHSTFAVATIRRVPERVQPRPDRGRIAFTVMSSSDLYAGCSSDPCRQVKRNPVGHE
jgi:hypothetical protein